MSQIAQYAENPKLLASLTKALIAVLEDGRVKNEAAVAVASKIVTEQSVAGLSPNEVATFENELNIALTIKCEGHCDSDIPLEDIAGAIANEFEDGGLLCLPCSKDMRVLMQG